MNTVLFIHQFIMNMVKKLFLVKTGENSCATHDGYIQLGVFNHSLEKHLELNPTIDWQITYWMPDIWVDRYQRVSFQKTQKANEGSPKTDNSSNYGSVAE